MNKTLIRAAAVINIVAASLIYVACSGEDGSDGNPGAAGAGCTVGAAANGGTDITCGTTVTNIPPNVGGGCTINRTSTGSFVASCNGVEYPVAGGGGNGGCVGSESADGAYYILTCGGAPIQIAKGWCAGVAFNPAKQACDQTTGQISENRCGTLPIDLDRQFCVANRIYTLCGIWTVKPGVATAAKLDDYIVAGAKEYNPLTEFCGANIYKPTAEFTSTSTIARIDTVYARCGATLTAVPIATDFSSSALTAKSTNLLESIPGSGSYDPTDNFCYSSTTGDLASKERCGTTADEGTISSGLSYTFNETCVSDALQGSCDGKAYSSANVFCHKGLELWPKCDTASAATPTKFVSYDPETEFCSPTVSNKQNTSFTLSSTGSVTISAHLKGAVLPLCGSAGKTSDGGRRTYHSAFEFCLGEGASAKIVTKCGPSLKISVFDDPTYSWHELAYAPTTYDPRVNTGDAAITESAVKEITVALNSAFSSATGNFAKYHSYLALDTILPTTVAAAANVGEISIAATSVTGVSYDPNPNFCGTYSSQQKVLEKCAGAAYDASSKYCASSGVENLLKCNDNGSSGDDYNPTLQYCDKRVITSNKGVLYDVIKVGNVTWLAENLSYPGLSGSSIGAQYGKETAGKTDTAGVYGRLYTYPEASVACNDADGWRLPTDADWTALSTAAGGSASKLKSSVASVSSALKQVGWVNLGTDDLGFKGLPAGTGVYSPGYVPPVGTNPVFDSDEILFSQARANGYWWSATPVAGNDEVAKWWGLSFNSNAISQGQGSIYTDYYSVRCVK